MEDSTAIGLFAVVALILSAGALVISLQVSNPLFRTETYRLAAVVGLAVPVAAVTIATVLGVRGRPRSTAYW